MGSMGSFGSFGSLGGLVLVVDVVVTRRVVDVRRSVVLVVAGRALFLVELVVGDGSRPAVDDVLVVVVVTVSARPGHADGAGAFRAANFPGSSRRTSPPKSRQ